MTTTDELAKKAINHARENPNLLKTHIFFEATRESHWCSIHECCFESYKKMCRKYGDDAMDYQEFEFWYMRFSRGEFDMDYDRRLAPINRSFTDLPVHIFEMIAENFDLYDRLVLHDVSKALRSVIDPSLPIPSEIYVNLRDGLSILKLDNTRIEYAQGTMSTDWRRVAMPKKNHWAQALSHSQLFFQNPELRLKNLKLHYSDVQSSSRFNRMLQIAQNKKIHVESLEIISDCESVDLNTLIPLQYLDTGSLQTLHLSCRTKVSDIKKILEKIVGSEQFQRNPKIECEGKILVGCGLRFILKPSEVTFHLCRLAPLHLAKLIKDLTQSTVREKFHLHASDADDFPVEALLAKHLKRPQFFKAKDVPANILFKKIQKDQFYRIEMTEKLITVEKVDHFY